MFKVTTTSMWEKPQIVVFRTLAEAQEYAREMRDLQYKVVVDSVDDEDSYAWWGMIE